MRRNIVLSLVGLLTGIAVAAMLALLINFVIQPKMQKETWGRESFSYGDFVLWYPNESAHIKTRDTLSETLAFEFAELLPTLGINRNELPEIIDVFIHENISQLMRSVALRKGQDTMNSAAPLDLIAGEDPRQGLAELIVCHGWGKSNSQVAYRGLITYLSNPEMNFFVPVAALPLTMRISPREIATLELGGLYPYTFYQQFVAPYSKRYILTLEDFAEYVSIPDRIVGSQDLDLPSLLAASLIQFIVEDVASLQILHDNWTGSNTTRMLESVSSLSLDELNLSWYVQAALRGAGDASGLWHARFATQSGDFTLAHSLTSAWGEEDLTKEQLEIFLLSAILFGDFPGAARLLASSESAVLPQELSLWADRVINMNRVTSDGIDLSANLPLTEMHHLLLQMEDVLANAQMNLGISSEALPLPLRVILYEDSGARDRGAALTQPDLSANPSIHLSAGGNAMEDLAISICSLGWGETRSSLLAKGVSRLLVEGITSVRESACHARANGDWNSWVRLCLQPAEDPIISVEMGLYVACILDLYAKPLMNDLWHLTTVWGGSHSVKGAIQSIEGMDFLALEERVQYMLSSCD